MKTRKNKFRKRNSEETRAAILQAVGDILRKDGHHGLSVTKVAAKADVDPKNIYAYFGDYNNLLKDYIHSTDSWFPILGEYGDGELPELSQLRDIIIGIFQNQFDTFGSNIEMQKFIFWQISSVNATMREVSEQRESRAALLLELADKHAKGGDISLRACFAIILGGIYYNVWHAENNKSSVCGIDINIPEEREIFRDTIKKLLRLIWEAAG
ncbi:TetR/AcrR family transcriptional regulator [Pedobacter sp. KBS0701]|uniref:TetR/AcrR family transcriptional regulator n=1 Tax=Pedobacter sp. KBS0701 TaxID=2578106 RepID=UPI00110DC46C|nr:TetR/AcrR family transcriptional regulator [Pedobacter sp. KBS0701]QDW27234.1 TetR/AcrR family transcriptional regulator [Pedobacter sp. KBS0701]